MGIYYTLYICIIIFSGLVYTFQRKSRSKFFLIFVGCVLVMLSGIRADYVGTDTYKYHVIFNLINSTDSSIIDLPKQEGGLLDGIEVGYIFFNRLVYFFHGDFHTLLFIISLITVFGIFTLIYKYSPNYFLSVWIYVGMGYYLLSFNIGRQFLATSIAYMGLTRNNKWQALIIIIIAGMIHYSALLLLILWILMQIRLKKASYMYIIPLSIIVMLGPVYLIILRIMKMTPKYNMYLDAVGSSAGIFNFLLLGILLVLYIIFLKYSYLRKDDDATYFVLYSFMLAIIFLFYTIMSPAFGRVQYVWLPLIVVGVPYVVECTPLKKYQFFVSLLFICIGFYLMTKIPNNLGYGIVPYGVF